MNSNIKKKLKKMPIANYINRIIKLHVFDKDKQFFKNNYMHSKKITKEKLEYELLLEIHKLEKGFSVNNPRPFGIDKIRKIIEIIKKYEEKQYKPDFSYNLAMSSLLEYKKFYEEKKWIDEPQYKIVSDFLNEKKEYVKLPVGSQEIKKKDFINDSKINYDKFLSSRHSIRNFAKKGLNEEDIKKATEIAIKSPSACNRQMCKLYYIKNEKNKKIVEKYAQGLGLFDLSNANYIIITFDVAANYFVGERNQGWFNAGLFSMNLVNALHSLGIGSCFIQFGNNFKEEEIIKKELDISKSERIAVIITCGYYDETSKIPYSTRKPIEEIYKER